MAQQGPSSSRYDSKPFQSPTKLSVQTTGTNKRPQTAHGIQCRICFETQAESPSKKFISPCECSGSLKYVHYECQQQWISKALEIKTQKQYQKAVQEGIECQMCKQRIKFETDGFWTCNNCSKFVQLAEKKTLILTVLIILFFISLAGMGYSIYSMVWGDAKIKQTEKDLRLQTILSICGGILMFMFLFIATYTFVMDYIVRYEYEIVRIGGTVQKKNNKIHPEQPSQLEIVQLQ